MIEFNKIYGEAIRKLQGVFPKHKKITTQAPVASLPGKFEGSIANLIDHTMLKPDATKGAIKRICEEALKYNFKSVCVAPCWVKEAKESLKGSKILVCTVIGFPHGNSTIGTKVFAAQEAIENGAKEIDMVINLGALKSQAYSYCLEEILAVKKAIGSNCLKVILETGLLTAEEKVLAALIALEAGADFVKTSTGFAGQGATTEDVTLLRQTVGYKIGVKASGGIRDFKTAQAMVEAGANRLGCSAGVKIMEESLSKVGLNV